MTVDEVAGRGAGGHRAVARAVHAERGRHLPRPDRARRAVVPILGVCLGHQAIGQAYGGRVVRAPTLMHGKLSKVHHTGKGVFPGIAAGLLGDALSFAGGRARKHARRARRSPPRPHDGVIMGLQHKRYPVHGVQFHPESIASEHGHSCSPISSTLPASGVRAARPTEKRPVPSSPAPASIAALADLGPVLAQGGARRDPHARPKRPTRSTIIMSGEATRAQIGALLMGCACAARRWTRSPAPPRAMRARADNGARAGRRHRHVGTGGDAKGTYNISTCAAFVVAGAGVPVAKHGNRVALLALRLGRRACGARRQYRAARPRRSPTASREAGSASCSRRPTMPPCAMSAKVARRARHAHHLQPARPARQSGRREVPNPRRVQRSEWVEPIAACARAARRRNAPGWCMARDGLDELTTTGPSAMWRRSNAARSRPSRSRRRMPGCRRRSRRI